MEVSSLNSFATLSSISRNGLLEKPFMFGKAINVTTNKRDGTRKLKILDCRAQASGITKVSSEALKTASRDANSKDENIVFVAGATGRVGSRTVRELLKLGFKVRAGVRNKGRAESLVQIVRQMKLKDASSGANQSIEKHEIVECDLEKPDQIGQALGKASIVICCIGASEKEIFDITGPYRIDYMATKNLIDAATSAKVGHFILVTSLGTNKFGFPAAILNLFWGVLCWKRKAEEALIASGLPYTIVRPGGMERPTDSYKLTHNITLSEEDTLFGGQVSNLQVAELIACMAKNRRISYCKVLEVVAETTAPLTPMEDLLEKIPSKRIEIYPSGVAGEPSLLVSEIMTSEPSGPVIVKETSPAKSALTRPLSPYTAYADLRPPMSPSPTPTTKTSDLKANLETLLPVSNSPPSAVESNSLGASNTVTKSASLKKEGKHSSSPYPNYPDLKPPVSPTPNKPGTPKDISTPESAPAASTEDSESKKSVEIVGDSIEKTSLAEQQLISRPLSPYTAYKDLKPPSSPSPTSSGPKSESLESGISDSTTQITRGNDQANTRTGLVEKDSSPSSAPIYSPYQAYEDLKPPSSPTPNAPVILEYDGIVPEQNPSVTEHESISTQYTLSPFTMYEDLKPPSSPSPSFREL